MKHNRLYNECVSWVVQECAEAVARHYLDRKRHRPAHSMKVEVVDTDTMETVNEYEIKRGCVK